MSKEPKTIEILLLDGTLTGSRKIEILGEAGKGFILQRENLKNILNNKDLNGPGGVYFLMERKSKTPVYVGYTGKIMADRINQWNRLAKFHWNSVICFINKELEENHLKYLESLFIKEIGIENLENNKDPEYNVRDSTKITADSFAYKIKLLLSAVGFTFLQEPSEVEDEDEEVFYCTTKGADAKGKLNPDGSFVVFKGSRLLVYEVKSFTVAESKKRKKILDSSAKKVGDKYYELYKKDEKFPTPSGAAGFVLGSRANGWTEWKNSKKQTLDEIKRQKKKKK